MKDTAWTTKLLFVGTVMAAVASGTAFLFLNFESKAESMEKHQSLEQRLDRIETKLDQVLEGRK